MKEAPNKLETYKIKELTEEGVSASEISARMKIKKESVEAWVTHFKPKKTRRKKTTEE